MESDLALGEKSIDKIELANIFSFFEKIKLKYLYLRIKPTNTHGIHMNSSKATKE
jgi:hypothetical protein